MTSRESLPLKIGDSVQAIVGRRRLAGYVVGVSEDDVRIRWPNGFEETIKRDNLWNIVRVTEAATS